MADKKTVSIDFDEMEDLNFDLPSVNNNFFTGTGIPSVRGSDTITSTDQYDCSWQAPTWTFAVLDSSLDGIYDNYTGVASRHDFDTAQAIQSFLRSTDYVPKNNMDATELAKYVAELNASRYLWVKGTQTKTIRINKGTDATSALFTITYKPICIGSIADILSQTGKTLTTLAAPTVTTYLTSNISELIVYNGFSETNKDGDGGYTYHRLFSTDGAHDSTKQPPSIDFANLMIIVYFASTAITHTVNTEEAKTTDTDKTTDPEKMSTTAVTVNLWYVTTYDSTLVFDSDDTKHELSSENVNIIRLKPKILNLVNRSTSQRVWTINRASEGLYIPITIPGGSRIWSWAGAPWQHIEVVCTVPSLLTWQEIVDDGYMPTYRQQISDNSYTTQVTLASVSDSATADFDVFGAYYLTWFWNSNVVGAEGAYKVDSIFPLWIFAKASTKTEGDTPVLPDLTFSVWRKASDESDFSLMEDVELNTTEVTCGLRHHLAGDPRLFKSSKFKSTEDSTKTYEYKYRMSGGKDIKNYYTSLNNKRTTVDDNGNIVWGELNKANNTTEYYIESTDIQQVLPDAYWLAKSFSEWPVNLNYSTVRRIKAMNTDDNPNTYKVIGFGTTLVTVNSDCNYYGFIPPKTGLYKFTAESTNAYIGYATTMIDEEGTEMFGEATWADDGLSFQLMCSANRMVFIACSTADFSYESYNLTIECLSE